ncbi:hypothetical protein ACJMK2_006909, partial [Sinanodonta woodiana]
ELRKPYAKDGMSLSGTEKAICKRWNESLYSCIDQELRKPYAKDGMSLSGTEKAICKRWNESFRN